MRRALLLFVTVTLGVTMFGLTSVKAEPPTTIILPPSNGTGGKTCTIVGSGPIPIVICH